MRITALLAALAIGLAACGSIAPPEPAKNFVEEVAYWEGKATAARTTIDQLTCLKGYDQAGRCLEPGKPVSPAVALTMQEQVKNARSALRAAVVLPQEGGACLPGAAPVQNPAACLQVAAQLLLNVEVLLRKQQGG